jgi:glucose/arabinose dehydrogenase
VALVCPEHVYRQSARHEGRRLGAGNRHGDRARQAPGFGRHWWRSLLVDDNGFYTSIGDSGNLTDESKTNPDRQKIWHYSLDGGDKKLFASGIRNTERLLFRPGTKEIWGCDHGSDNFGQKFGERTGQLQPITDLNPGDEFNHYEEGGFYGHPFLVGSNVPRAEFMDREDIVEMAKTAIAPEWLFHAHWAPNGWRFINGDYFPGFKGDAVVAFHGSWNSVQKVGYRVERVLFDSWSGKPYGTLRLVGTLSEDGRQVLARPVDVIEASDGTLLWSADDTKQIYRISKADGK